MYRVTVVSVLALLIACGGGAKDKECTESRFCDLEPAGVCTANDATGRTWCQYPDETCPAGMRWSDFQTGDGISGQCVASNADAGVSGRDGGIGDAGGLDASPGCNGCPESPQLLYPANGVTTGSVHASVSLRPTFGWTATATADRYEIQLDDSCSTATWRTCAFASPGVTVTDITTTRHQLAEFLAISNTAPVGRRYYWRVRACNTGGCSDWTAPRYLDVGRLRDDLNGDGYSDLIVGEILHDDGASVDEGAAYIYFGKSSWAIGGTVSTADTKIVSPLGQAAGRFGVPRAVGDVNGDGYSDLLIMAPRQSNPEDREGAAYLYFGRSSFTATLSGPDVTIDNPADEVAALMGNDAAAGDLDGDGYADIVIAAEFADGATVLNSGKAFVFRGRASWPANVANSDAVVTTPVEQLNARSAHRLDIADVNGDGLADIVAGTGSYSNPAAKEGSAFVYFGKESLAALMSDPEIVIDSPNNLENDKFGTELSICDTDDDGLNDIVVGATGVQSSEGAAYLYLGRQAWPSTLSLSDAVLSNPAAQPSQFSISITCADVDSGAGADVLVGAVDHDGPEVNEGAVFGFWGRMTWPSTVSTATTTLDNPSDTASTAFGARITASKDLNGDGRGDLVVGSNAQESVFVYFGRSSWAASIGASDITFSNPSGQSGAFGAELD